MATTTEFRSPTAQGTLTLAGQSTTFILLGGGLLTAGGYNFYYVNTGVGASGWTNLAHGKTYGFDIPEDATILGIQVKIHRNGDLDGSFPNSRTKDYAIHVLKNLALSTTNKAIANEWEHTFQYKTYGSTSELWGETWTPADINSANFGAGIAAQAIELGHDITPIIDTIEIAITYETGPAVDISAEYLPILTADINTAITNARTGANNKYFNVPIVNDVQIMFIHISQ